MQCSPVYFSAVSSAQVAVSMLPADLVSSLQAGVQLTSANAKKKGLSAAGVLCS